MEREKEGNRERLSDCLSGKGAKWLAGREDSGSSNLYLNLEMNENQRGAQVEKL